MHIFITEARGCLSAGNERLPSQRAASRPEHTTDTDHHPSILWCLASSSNAVASCTPLTRLMHGGCPSYIPFHLCAQPSFQLPLYMLYAVSHSDNKRNDQSIRMPFICGHDSLSSLIKASPSEHQSITMHSLLWCVKHSTQRTMFGWFRAFKTCRSA